MCAGAKVEQVKQMMKHAPWKQNEKRCLKLTRTLVFYFDFEYRNIVLSRETFICRFWLRSSAQENLYKPLRATNTTQNIHEFFLSESVPEPDDSGFQPEISGLYSPVYPDI
jgi:hypothetical protein